MGIDVQRIAKTESLPMEHFCPFCKLLINPDEAFQSMCGHSYCKPCLTYVASTFRACPYDGCVVTQTDAKPLMESNKVLADTIGRTLVYCSYKNSGCAWMGTLADSSIHCSGCDFGEFAMCCWCGINIAHREWQEHVQVCRDDYPQASVAMATSQASAHGHLLAASTLPQEHWYQQPYQYYQNYVGDYMQQQPMLLPSLAPQHQVVYVPVQPAVQYVAQTHSQMQPQPHVPSKSFPMHQPHDAFPSPQANTVQYSLAQSTIGQYQSNQPHASWTGLNPHPNQTNHREESTTDVDHKQMHQEGPSYQPHIALQEHLHPTTSILGVQQHMNHFADTAPQVGLGQAEPRLPAVKEDGMQRIQQLHWPPLGPNKVIHIYGNKDDEAVMECSLTPESTNDVYNVNPAAEVTTIKFDHKHKGKLTDVWAESMNRSSFIVEGNEIKSGSLSKLVMEENVGDGWEDVGKSLLVDKNGINNDPSINGTPLLNPSLVGQDGLPQLSNLKKHYLMIAEKYKALSDRGFDQRSSIRTHEKHEPDFELIPALTSSQDPICEHFGMPSLGLGGSQAVRTDTEGRYGSSLHRSGFKGLGNLQMGEKVRDVDMIGPVYSNGLRPGGVGSQSSYTLQGYPGDGGSFLGDWSTKHAGSSDCHSQTKEHQQKKYMDMVSKINHNEKKHTMALAGSSRFGNQNKNGESKFKGSG